MVYCSRNLIAIWPLALQVLFTSVMTAMLHSEARPFSLTTTQHMEVRVMNGHNFAVSEEK